MSRTEPPLDHFVRSKPAQRKNSANFARNGVFRTKSLNPVQKAEKPRINKSNFARNVASRPKSLDHVKRAEKDKFIREKSSNASRTKPANHVAKTNTNSAHRNNFTEKIEPLAALLREHNIESSSESDFSITTVPTEEEDSLLRSDDDVLEIFHTSISSNFKAKLNSVDSKQITNYCHTVPKIDRTVPPKLQLPSASQQFSDAALKYLNVEGIEKIANSAPNDNNLQHSSTNAQLSKGSYVEQQKEKFISKTSEERITANERIELSTHEKANTVKPEKQTLLKRLQYKEKRVRRKNNNSTGKQFSRKSYNTSSSSQVKPKKQHKPLERTHSKALHRQHNVNNETLSEVASQSRSIDRTNNPPRASRDVHDSDLLTQSAHQFHSKKSPSTAHNETTHRLKSVAVIPPTSKLFNSPKSIEQEIESEAETELNGRPSLIISFKSFDPSPSAVNSLQTTTPSLESDQQTHQPFEDRVGLNRLPNKEKLTPAEYEVYLRDSVGCTRSQKRAIRRSILKGFYNQRLKTKERELSRT